jgi:hypothetical protein
MFKVLLSAHGVYFSDKMLSWKRKAGLIVSTALVSIS